jgi:predicted PurR-regulated permease PerM
LNKYNPIFLFFLACFVVSIFFLGWLLLPFLSILVLGTVVSGICYPAFRFLQARLMMRPFIAAFVVCFLIFLLLLVPTVFFIGSLTQQAFSLYEMARGAAINEQINALMRDSRLLDRANYFLSNFNYTLTGEEIKGAVSEMGRFVGLFLYEQARAIASNTFAFVAYFFLMLMVVFFLLLDGHRLLSYISDLSPLPPEQENMLIEKFKDMSNAILIGNGLGGLIQGVVGGLLFWGFGFQRAFLWGVIMALLAFIPIVGIGAVFIPTTIYLFISGKTVTGIVSLISYVVLSGGVDYYFKPKLVGHQVKMHPLLVFLAIIGGLNLFGILGIIYGPLVVTAFLTMADIYRTNYQRLVESRDS